MMMDSAPMHGIPWLDQPVMLHSSRAYQCKLKSARLCEYQQGYWRFWYEADHRYALPTVIFFLSIIGLFTIMSLVSWYFRPKRDASPSVQRIQAAKRYLSYRTLRISRLNWNTAPLGVLALGGVGMIFFFSMTLGPKPYYWPNTSTVTFGGSPPIANRAGWMSLGCLPFILATASKSNMITAMIGVPHERLQVFHRWISYTMYILALIHTFPFIIYNISNGTMTEQWNTEMGYWTGIVAILAQSWLVFASLSPFRNLRYELFKFTHFLAATIFTVFFFLHCDFRLSSWDYFIATAVIYTLSVLHSRLRTHITLGPRHASLSRAPNPGSPLRLAIPLRGIRWRAGQHFFLRFPDLGAAHAWSSHPFTACSLPARAAFFDAADAELVFYVRPRGGITAELAKRAGEGSGGEVRVMLDGPYGGVEMRRLVEMGRLVVVVGGSGAGFALPLVESFLRRVEVNGEEGEEGPSMRVVVATRERGTGEWFEGAVGELLRRYEVGRRAALSVEIYCTGSVSSRTGGMVEDVEKGIVVGTRSAGSDSDSENVKETPSMFGQFGSRPDLPAVISAEAMTNPSMGVFVCGPLSMQHDVASAVAREQLNSMKDGARDIYLHTEHFSWA